MTGALFTMTNAKADYYRERAEQYERLSDLLVSDYARREVCRMAARCRELARLAQPGSASPAGA